MKTQAQGIDDGTKKTGRMVASFAKSYHEITGKKLIGISASKGGTSVNQWVQGTSFMTDTINRLNTFKTFAQQNKIDIGHIYMVWCQGEGDASMARSTYEAQLANVFEGLKPLGVEKCFLVRIGHLSNDTQAQAQMIQNQTDICRENDDIVLIGNLFTEFHDGKLGMMTADTFHYLQPAYNIQGRQAGTNFAFYLNNSKEPTMYDKEYGELYYSYNNGDI